MKRVSEKTKIREHRGTGILESYRPWIKTREFMRGVGTRCNPIDPKTGRTMHLLSQNEMYAYYLLRWDDHVTDIREQFPLDKETTTEIAERFGFNPVQYGKTTLTTDMLVTYDDDYDHGLRAYSIKNDPESLSVRAKERLLIEKQYWMEKGVPFLIWFKGDLDIQKANNLRTLYPYYKAETLRPGNQDDLIRHLIITKQIEVDLSKPIDYQALKKRLEMSK